MSLTEARHAAASRRPEAFPPVILPESTTQAVQRIREINFFPQQIQASHDAIQEMSDRFLTSINIEPKPIRLVTDLYKAANTRDEVNRTREWVLAWNNLQRDAEAMVEDAGMENAWRAAKKRAKDASTGALKFDDGRNYYLGILTQDLVVAYAQLSVIEDFTGKNNLDPMMHLYEAGPATLGVTPREHFLYVRPGSLV